MVISPGEGEAAIRWLQIDFMVSAEDIVNESNYYLTWDPTLEYGEDQEPQPARMYEFLRPLFQLDHDIVENPSKARIAAPGTDEPIDGNEAYFSCPCDYGKYTPGYGYGDLTYGDALDAREGKVYLTYSRPGNLTMSHGTLEFWFKPDWSVTAVAETKQPVVFNLFDTVNPDANAMKVAFWLNAGEPGSAHLGYEFKYDDGGQQVVLQCSKDLQEGDDWVDLDWNHVAVSWDLHHGIRLFLNGKLVASNRETFEAEDNVPPEFVVGTFDWDGPTGYPESFYYTDGIVDHLRIFEDFTEEISFTQQTFVLPFDGYKAGSNDLRPSVAFNRSPVWPGSGTTVNLAGVRDEAMTYNGSGFTQVDATHLLWPGFGCIDFWLHLGGNPDTAGIFQLRTNGEDPTEGIRCWYSSGELHVSFDDGVATPIVMEGAVDNDKWCHVTILFRDPSIPLADALDEVFWDDTYGCGLFINGTYADSALWDDNLGIPPSKDLRIGTAYVGAADVNLEGSLDHFRIWSYPRMPREKLLAFCDNAYYQIRMDRMNYIDYCQVDGKVIVDSRDLTGGGDTGQERPGFIVRDAKVDDRTDTDDFYSALASYYKPVTLKDPDNGSDMVVSVYNPKYPSNHERMKINDFKVTTGPIRTTVEVRSLCVNHEGDDQSGHAISCYHLFPGVPFIRNYFTFV